MPTHYAFKIKSKIEELEKEYQTLRRSRDRSARSAKPSAQKVRKIVDSLDPRGAWVDAGNMKGYGKASKEGVIESETFVKNVQTLCDYLQISR